METLLVLLENFLQNLSNTGEKSSSSRESILKTVIYQKVQCCQILRKSLSRCKQLTHLTLSGNKVGNAGEDIAKSIQQWEPDPPLESLHLDNCSIPEKHCSTIFQSLHPCIHLKELNMDGNTIGATGNFLAESTSQWGCNSSLQILSLEKCSITEDICSKIMNSLRNMQKAKISLFVV